MSAPIALFAFARPDHTRATLEALARNRGAATTDLHVFCDGSRGPATDAAVAEVRRVAAAASGFRSVSVHARPENFGLARNIVEGVGEILATEDRVIVVEDDIVTSPGFLDYMNGALDFYAEDERVASIHGYVYPVAAPLPEAFFLRGADCWGWATWRRAWRLFRPDGQALLDELEARNLIEAFDFDGAYSYSGMLRDQIAGRNNSWAVRWHASAFLADRLTLYPGRSFVLNIGIDGSGENCAPDAAFDGGLYDGTIDFSAVPVAEDAAARGRVIDFFRGRERPERLGRRIARRIAGWFR